MKSAIALLFLALGSALSAAAKQNIILILADDLGAKVEIEWFVQHLKGAATAAPQKP